MFALFLAVAAAANVTETSYTTETITSCFATEVNGTTVTSTHTILTTYCPDTQAPVNYNSTVAPSPAAEVTSTHTTTETVTSCFTSAHNGTTITGTTTYTTTYCPSDVVTSSAAKSSAETSAESSAKSSAKSSAASSVTAPAEVTSNSTHVPVASNAAVAVVPAVALGVAALLF